MTTYRVSEETRLSILLNPFVGYIRQHFFTLKVDERNCAKVVVFFCKTDNREIRWLITTKGESLITVNVQMLKYVHVFIQFFWGEPTTNSYTLWNWELTLINVRAVAFFQQDKEQFNAKKK